MSSDPEVDHGMLEALIGQRVRECEPLAGFAANAVVAVTLDSDIRAVVKVASKREIEVEIWALRSMAEHRIPVPEILAGSADASVPRLMTRRLRGREGIGTIGAARSLGQLIRTVHGFPVLGAGFFKDSYDTPPTASPGTWAGRVAELVDRLAPIAADGYLRPTLLSKCRGYLLDSTRWHHPCVFVHGDLHPRHVFHTGGRIEGLIDWADCGAVPRWWDLARADLGTAGLRQALLDGYFSEGIPAETASNIANYRFLQRLLALIWEYEGGGDWLHERVPGIEEALVQAR